MLKLILDADIYITSFLNARFPHNIFFDQFFSFFSLHGLTILIWLILFLFFIYREKFDKRHHHFLLAFAISFVSTAFLVNIVIKNIVMRPRPWVRQHLITTSCPADFSFPSGHASTAFAGAVIFAFFDKKRRGLYYGIATLIALSRIYLTCHYMLDVIFGAFIGYIIGKLVLWILSYKKII